MNKLCQLLNLENEDVLFAKITNSFKEKIIQWGYFVDWKKVFRNISPIEKELNLLNYLIGKENIEEETFKLIKQYPQIIRVFPILIAICDKSIDILIETKDFIYEKFSFTSKTISDEECTELTEFVIKSGLGEILRDKKIKNLVDYAVGVEVGLDNNGKLYFIETNFYGGGSKLKSTATEYIQMNRYWNKQEIEFIWVTDGAGWKSTLKPLREYFDKADYLLNLEMLKENILKKILN